MRRLELGDRVRHREIGLLEDKGTIRQKTPCNDGSFFCLVRWDTGEDIGNYDYELVLVSPLELLAECAE